MAITSRHRTGAVLLLSLAVTACSSGAKPNHPPLPATVAAAASPSPTATGEPKTYDGVEAAVDRID